MEKGILYLICSVIIIVVVLFGAFETNKTIAKDCAGKAITVVISPTPEPTIEASPTATLKPLLKVIK